MPEDDKRAKPLPPQFLQNDENSGEMPEPPQRLVDLAKQLEEKLQRRRPGSKADGASQIRGPRLH
ncbi:hypothetical protein [Frigidibacter sp. MR17.24]|uniref:hypothetical protein n=1 Tax=Frigidibacter sp. MR17.24 TaxID=3127345 RepID=UPI003012CC57